MEAGDHGETELYVEFKLEAVRPRKIEASGRLRGTLSVHTRSYAGVKKFAGLEGVR